MISANTRYYVGKSWWHLWNGLSLGSGARDRLRKCDQFGIACSISNAKNEANCIPQIAKINGKDRLLSTVDLLGICFIRPFTLPCMRQKSNAKALRQSQWLPAWGSSRMSRDVPKVTTPEGDTNKSNQRPTAGFVPSALAIDFVLRKI